MTKKLQENKLEISRPVYEGISLEEILADICGLNRHAEEYKIEQPEPKPVHTRSFPIDKCDSL